MRAEIERFTPAMRIRLASHLNAVYMPYVRRSSRLN